MSDKESHVSMESPESSSGLNSENFQAQPADKASMKKPGRRANINVRDSQNMGVRTFWIVLKESNLKFKII